MGKTGRRAPSKPSLATRIQTDPVYQAVIRVVGYLGTVYPIGRDDAARLDQAFGKDKVMAAATELLDFNADAHIARLKPGVRRLSAAVIGPAPEDWDNFYEGIENPPPNPYRKVTDAAAEAAASASHAEAKQQWTVPPNGDGHARQILGMQPSRFAEIIRPLADHTDERLLELLDTCHYELTKAKPRSVTFREALRDIGRIAAELQRRDRADQAPAAAPSRRHR